MKHLLDMSEQDLAAELTRIGQSGYRAGQVLQWVWAKGATDFAAMTNLPAALREELAPQIAVLSGRLVDQRAARDGVIKLLIEWPDGQRVETVLIPADKRITACLSTQAGCAIGCAFCASGIGGLGRNLTAGEMVEQVFQLQAAGGKKVTHVVFMGTGEPLANYDATLAAVRALIDPARGGLSGRHMTISTIGLPAAMRRLATEGIPLTLAISLHAPDDVLRRRLIPAAKSVPIADILAAARDYFDRTGRELTVEYLLLRGVNDTPEHANRLAALVRPLRCNVNLIRYNPVAGLPFERSEESRTRDFRDRLQAAGVNVQIRASRGGEIQAACGQLRRDVKSETEI
jgi:23S rRNA (adenine2503-C2)-methyltransferase